MKISGVYKITNTKNGRVYIGSSRDIKRRWKEHKHKLSNTIHPNIHLQSAWDKYGRDVFKFEILFFCKVERLIHFEQIFIDFYIWKIGWKVMYNNVPNAGSNLGYKQTEEAKMKISEAGKKRVYTSERNNKISEALMNRKLTSEHRKSLSISYMGNIPWNRGIPCSDEQKSKISKANKGRKLSNETRKNMSEGQTGRKHFPRTQEWKDKQSKAQKLAWERKKK